MGIFLGMNNRALAGSWFIGGILALGVAGCASLPPNEVADHELIILSDNQEVISGKLDNGFAYHIDTWAQGSPTVELRLKVDFGSLDESEDELGYAHFIEHMAFNGTQNYPNQTLTDYLKSTGMDFGGDINAYTSFDETVYRLSIPADQPELIRQGFDVMAEWAARIEFDAAEVEAEKGIIIEEWRLNYAGDPPVWLQQQQSRYAGTEFETRLPIGTVESVQSATPEKLLSLYERYYQADRMTLYVSGMNSAITAHEYIDQAFGTQVVVPQGQLPACSPESLTTKLAARSQATVPAMIVNFEHQDEQQLNVKKSDVISVLDTPMANLKRIELSNGLTVWFYASDIEPNRVVVNLVNLVSRGGLAASSKRDATLKLFWANVLSETSLTGMSKTSFGDWMNRNGIDGNAYTLVGSSGLYWDGKPESLETMLALTARQMHPMPLDDGVVREYVEGTRSHLAEYRSTPGVLWNKP